MTSSELPPMVVQYTGYVIQTETHDQYSALSLVIRYNFHGLRLRAEVNSFRPIPPFIFPLQSLFCLTRICQQKV